MFFKRDARKSSLLVSENPPIKSAIDVVRETISQRRDDCQLTHEDRVRQLKLPPFEYFWNKEETMESNLRVFVNSSWINNFKYHACVYGKSSNFVDTEYAGDIPESVLEKALKARELPWINYITIHSNYPLPTKFANFDPVMLGWNNLLKAVDGSFIHTDRIGRLITPAAANKEAVIIAVWDNDKEIESF